MTGSYYDNIPQWVVKHYARLKELGRTNECDIPECNCHWVESLKKRPES